jgi:peroxiredoxin
MNQVKAIALAAAAVGLAFSAPASAAPEKTKSVEKAVGEKAVMTTAAEKTSGDRKASDFTLTDLDGKKHHLQDYLDAGNTVVLEWFNPECPFVKKHHEKNKTMSEIYTKYSGKKVVWLAINSGAPGMQGAGVERNREAVEAYGISYPMLLDEDGSVGQAYGAKATPHMYVIASSGELLYRGAIDDNNTPATLGETNYVADCLAKATAGEPVEFLQTKAYGCEVKYAKKATL